MAAYEKTSVDRRDFLKGAAVGAAALVASPRIAAEQQSETTGRRAPAMTSQEDIIEMKGRIALATLMLAGEGIVGSSGHVSMRIPGTDHVLVGPSDVSRNVI